MAFPEDNLPRDDTNTSRVLSFEVTRVGGLIDRDAVVLVVIVGDDGMRGFGLFVTVWVSCVAVRGPARGRDMGEVEGRRGEGFEGFCVGLGFWLGFGGMVEGREGGAALKVGWIEVGAGGSVGVVLDRGLGSGEMSLFEISFV